MAKLELGMDLRGNPRNGICRSALQSGLYRTLDANISTGCRLQIAPLLLTTLNATLTHSLNRALESEIDTRLKREGQEHG